MILVIDNYDSFTYNLVQQIGELGGHVAVYRNDKITLKNIANLKPKKIIISPGPGYPQDAGISIPVVKEFAGRIPMLGVCLGHQSIAAAFGGKIVRAKRLMHGKTSFIYHDGKRVYRDLDNPFEATRYHSLLVDKQSLPDKFIVTAWTKQQEIMGIRHKKWLIEGVQFHPESFMTTQGKELLRNFLRGR
ncbi:MAG: aminodeoxychorismate/anthranilate synthase component II [bacterium]